MDIWTRNDWLRRGYLQIQKFILPANTSGRKCDELHGPHRGSNQWLARLAMATGQRRGPSRRGRKPRREGCYFRNLTSDPGGMGHQHTVPGSLSLIVLPSSPMQPCSWSHRRRIAIARMLAAHSNPSHAVPLVYAPTFGSHQQTRLSSS